MLVLTLLRPLNQDDIHHKAITPIQFRPGNYSQLDTYVGITQNLHTNNKSKQDVRNPRGIYIYFILINT